MTKDEIRDHNLAAFVRAGREIDVPDQPPFVGMCIFWNTMRFTATNASELPSEQQLNALLDATSRACTAAMSRTRVTPTDGDGVSRLERWLRPAQDLKAWRGHFSSVRAKIWAAMHPRADRGLHFGSADQGTGRVWLYCGNDDRENVRLLVHELTHLAATDLSPEDHDKHSLAFHFRAAEAWYEIVERHNDPVLALSAEDAQNVMREAMLGRAHAANLRFGTRT